MINFNLDTKKNTKELKRYWNFCIGNCHAYTMLRSDIREQLLIAKKECNFRYIRFHGLFNDDMSVVNKDLFGNITYSFFNIDNIYDYILSIGMKPFVEIGFMPKALSSGDQTIFHYKGNVTLPRSYEEWNKFIKAFINHLIDRYGLEEIKTWFFEFWNEPNISEDLGNVGGQFFAGTKNDYFEFFKETFKSIKEVNKDLVVGGPATSNNKWISDFINYCDKENIKPDFISTHQYPADIVVCSDYGRNTLQTVISLFKTDPKKAAETYFNFKKDVWKDVPRGILTTMAKKVKEEAKDYPLYYTEWSSLAGLDTDSNFGSSFIIKTIMDNIEIIDGYSYWCLSDIFEESPQKSKEFHGGYGIFTYHAIKKAPYNAFKLLELLPNEIYLENKFSDDTLDIHSFKEDDNTYYILLNNHHSLLHDISEKEVNITLNNRVIKNITKYIIDEDHSNAYIYFKNKYNKDILTNDEIEDIKNHSELYKIDEKINDTNYNLVVKKQGTVLLKINL